MKLTYVNDQQVIADAAKMLIENHLHWSGSNESLPSNSRSGVECELFSAYVEANLFDFEWDDLGVEDKRLYRDRASLLFEKAAQLADRKWQAAMTLLGIER